MQSFKNLLTELYGVASYYGAENLNQIFKDLGLVNLGSGAFSSVWEVPGKNYVIKTWTTDEAYETFLSYCAKHQRNPYLPKIKGRLKSIPAVYKRHWKEEVVKIVKLERLQKIDQEAFNMFMYIKNIDETWGKYKTLDEIYNAYDDPILNSQILGLYQTYRALTTDLGKPTDLHDANLMQREDGTIVLTDPYANFKKQDEIASLILQNKVAGIVFDKPYYKNKDKQ